MAGPKRNALKEFWKNKTPEEKAAFFAWRTAKLAEKKAEKEKKGDREREELGSRAVELAVCELEPIKTKDAPDWRPSPYLVQAIWDAIDAGVQTSQIAEQLEKAGYSAKAWAKIQKFVFEGTVTQTEDIGIRILSAARFATRALKNEYQYMKERQKKKPDLYSKEVIECARTLVQIETALSKELATLGLIASKKSGGGGIHLHLGTPRPQEVVVETKSGETTERQAIEVTDTNLVVGEITDGSDRSLSAQRVADCVSSIPRPT